jgi:hypothetical protein
MVFTGTCQSVLHELTYLLSQESTSASTQCRANKYDCSQGHGKAFYMNWHICCPRKISQHLHNASILNMIFTGTWQRVLHELTYLQSLESTSAFTQCRASKYDCSQGHGIAFCMNCHICSPRKVHQHLHNAVLINMIFTGTWQSVLHELTYLLS